jgi:hypothetical protein
MGEEVEEVRKEWDELEGTTLFDEYGTARKAKNVKRGHSSYMCVCVRSACGSLFFCSSSPRSCAPLCKSTASN